MLCGCLHFSGVALWGGVKSPALMCPALLEGEGALLFWANVFVWVPNAIVWLGRGPPLSYLLMYLWRLLGKSWLQSGISKWQLFIKLKNKHRWSKNIHFLNQVLRSQYLPLYKKILLEMRHTSQVIPKGTIQTNIVVKYFVIQLAKSLPQKVL